MKSFSHKTCHLTLFFCAGLILATGVFEMFLRATEFIPGLQMLPVAQASLYAPDHEVGYSFRPNSSGFWDTENRAYIEINSHGYRGQEAGDDKVDIAFAGNSLTEALQVEEHKTFAFLAGQKLNVKTANLGISGAPPAVVVARLRKYMPVLKPKLIVVVVETRFFEQAAVLKDHAYVGYKINADGTGADLSYSFRESRNYKIRTSKIGDLIYWALDNLRIANVLNNTLNRGLFRAVYDLRGPTKVKTVARNIGTEESFFDLWVQGKPEDHRIVLEAFLQDLADLEAEYEANVIVAVTTSWKESDTDTLKAVAQAMKAMTNQYGVTIVNLTPLIQAHYPDGATSVAYRGFRPPWRGGHLNETGHIIYTDALADMIRRQKLNLIDSGK